MVPQSRRRLLQTGCAAGVVALAGCLGGDGDSQDGDTNGGENGGQSTPQPYPEFVATGAQGAATAVYADFNELQSNDDGFDSLFSESSDPLLLLPAQGVGLLQRSSAQFQAIGLGSLLDPGSDETESAVGGVLLATRALVATGEIVPAEVDEALLSTDGRFGPFEQNGERGRFELYGATSGPTVVAVSGTAVVVGGGRAPVERAIEAASGERTRARDEIDTFGWVLDTVEEHDVVFAGHGGEAEDDANALSDADSFAATHRFGGGQLRAELAAVYESGAALDDATEELETVFGEDADSVSTEFDDDRVSIVGSYEAGDTS